jgi:hypothetical protein
MYAGVAILVMAAATAVPDTDAQNRAWCAIHRNDDSGSRANCADRAWCDTHWNDDRISRLACDQFRSLADPRLPAPSVTAANLNATRNLSGIEKRANCPDLQNVKDLLKDGCNAAWEASPAESWLDASLLPPGVKDVKLALRASIIMGPFPPMVVTIGLESGQSGVISVSAGVPRRVRTARLNTAEVGRLIAALNQSHFWQLPEQGRHQGAADGMMANIEVSTAGMRRHVTDWVGGSVDLSVLARSITTIVFAHWQDI